MSSDAADAAVAAAGPGMPWWAWVGVGVLLLNAKGQTFMYHLQCIRHFIAAGFRGRFTSVRDTDTIGFRCWPSEMDWNMHMNNAAYNLTADFARFAFLRRLMGRRAAGHGGVRVHNGGVSMRFLRQIDPLAAYEVTTGIAGFDRKWIFLRHLFHAPGKPDKVHAQGMCKLVVKELSGKTVPPVEAFEMCGYPETDWTGIDASGADPVFRAGDGEGDGGDGAGGSPVRRSNTASKHAGPDESTVGDPLPLLDNELCRAYLHMESKL